MARSSDAKKITNFFSYKSPTSMVETLFTFIEASIARNWLLDLSAAKDLMANFVSVVQIKYHM